MRFERGKDPKEAMGLGMEEKASDYLSNKWGEYAEVMYTKAGRAKLRKAFLEEFGAPLIIMRRGSTFFFRIEGKTKNMKLYVKWTIYRSVTDDTGPK